MGSSATTVLAVVFAFLAVHWSDLGLAFEEEGKALLEFREWIEDDPFGYLLDWGEKEGEVDPCAWNGVACEDGKVVSLNLANLCLRGKLSPVLGKLFYLKYFLLHNNSFYGTIPREIRQLENLEVLDLGYNNLSGHVPDLDNLLFLNTVVIEGNCYIDSQKAHGFLGLQFCGPSNGDGVLSSTSTSCMSRVSPIRRLQSKDNGSPQTGNPAGSMQGIRDIPGETEDLSPPSQSPKSPPPPYSSSPPPPSASTSPPLHLPPPPPGDHSPLQSQKRGARTVVHGLVGGGAGLLILALVAFTIFHVRKVLIKPWVTGLSGQLRKAFVAGLPKLKRSELETACEDFSNIVGTLMDGTLYKGTLSNGVEIGVSIFKTDNWPEPTQAQFRMKITTLSKVNHKNFVNLIGYCEDEKPLSRMLVFEYSPNGKLYEHLHNIESHIYLNWSARMRVAMGVAYCLDHMHQLSPPIILGKLDSSSVYLTDDFAAKVADLELWSKTSELGVSSSEAVHCPENVVYLFGTLLLELISGRPPFSDENGSLISWAADYLNGTKPFKDAIDQAMGPVSEVHIETLFNVVKVCLNPDATQRPSMDKVVGMLKGITSVNPEAAAPRLSPVWWAELEIISRDTS